MEKKVPIEATCPECRGPLSETQFNGIREYRCLVGHAFGARSLLTFHSEAQEKALWAAVVVLEEAAVLAGTVAPQFPSAVAERLEKQAEKKMRQAAQIRHIVEELEPFSVD